MSPMAMNRRGTANTAPIRKRRVMSISSSLGGASRVTSIGSNAMPQLGHDPGPT